LNLFKIQNLWICIEKFKKKRKEYEQNRVFQDVRNVKLSWVELVVDEQRKMHQVRFVPK
jgi:predicted nucleotidyltransferase